MEKSRKSSTGGEIRLKEKSGRSSAPVRIRLKEKSGRSCPIGIRLKEKFRRSSAPGGIRPKEKFGFWRISDRSSSMITNYIRLSIRLDFDGSGVYPQQFGSHSKKRPNNLVLGRMYDHHIYDLVEVGVENFRPIESFEYDKKITPQTGSKPFLAFIGEGFESVEELKHLKEVLLDLFRGEVVENLNLAGTDRVFVCTAISSTTVFFTHCALRLKRSGTSIPRMELVEVGPSMDLVVRRHRLPNDSLKKEAMKTASDQPKKRIKNVSSDIVQGKIGKIYIPDQQVGNMPLSSDIKGLKRERREAKKNKVNGEDQSKKRKMEP